MKKLLCLFLCALLMNGSLAIFVSADSGISVLLNGTLLEFDVPPQMIDSRTMVPMRAIFEALNVEIEWFQETQLVVAFTPEKTIHLTVGEKTVDIMRGDEVEHIELDVPAQIVEGRTLVPVRFIAESLGAKVDWDGDTSTVIITVAEATADTPVENVDLYAAAAEYYTQLHDFALGMQREINSAAGFDYDPAIIRESMDHFSALRGTFEAFEQASAFSRLSGNAQFADFVSNVNALKTHIYAANSLAGEALSNLLVVEFVYSGIKFAEAKAEIEKAVNMLPSVNTAISSAR